MSLREIYLDELKVMAKTNDPNLTAKLREVLVDRHPATLAPDEYDPAQTVAVLWLEATAAGRKTLERIGEETINRFEQATASSDPTADWPFIHALCRVMRLTPPDKIDFRLRERCSKKLAQMLKSQWGFLTPIYSLRAKLWVETFQLAQAWKPPTWLENAWQLAVAQNKLAPDDGLCLTLEAAAEKHPGFVTISRLETLCAAGRQHNCDPTDMRRWFYIIGAMLEKNPDGRKQLASFKQLHADSKIPESIPATVFTAMFRDLQNAS